MFAVSLRQNIQMRRVFTKEELASIIEEAFADIQYPGDENLVLAHDPNDQEYLDAHEFFYKKHWRELAHGGQKLPIGWGGLPFLTPQAWRFYLPAYMLVALTETSIFHEVKDMTLANLNPPLAASLQSYFQERVVGLSPTQIQAVANFIVYICQKLPSVYAEDCQAAQGFWFSKLESVA